MLSEDNLLDGLKRGDDQSYVQLVRTHSGALLKIARRYLDEDEARDAVQEAFLKAFRSIDGFRYDACLSTWLHRIVINCCLSQLRRSKRDREVSIDDLLPRFLQDGHRVDPAPAWTLSLDDILQRYETQQLVKDLLKRLPEPYRTVLLLRDIDGFDSKETAQLLNVSVAAVKVRLHRARQAMRELLEPHVNGTADAAD